MIEKIFSYEKIGEHAFPKATYHPEQTIEELIDKINEIIDVINSREGEK